MRSSYKSFTHTDSYNRMEEILQESENSFEELDAIPSTDRLSFTNGFYVMCSALFIDIRGSSQLTQKHNRPKLAKLYRVYTSEVVAVMNDNASCFEVSIVGDGISGIFNTRTIDQIDDVFETAFTLSSVIDIMNFKFKKYGVEQITVGIGIDYGRALMAKAGYKGSGINDVVWMGDVVNYASKLCSYGNKTWQDYEIMVSNDIYNNLNDHNRSLLCRNSIRGCYHGNVIHKEMNDWLQEEIDKSKPKTTSWR